MLEGGKGRVEKEVLLVVSTKVKRGKRASV